MKTWLRVSGGTKMSIDHVALVVSDINASVSWYAENFNALVDYQDDSWAMLNIGGDKIALTQKGTHPPHVAILVESIEDFPDNAEVKTHRDGSHYFYAKDLDENIIEYICYESNWVYESL